MKRPFLQTYPHFRALRSENLQTYALFGAPKAQNRQKKPRTRRVARFLSENLQTYAVFEAKWPRTTAGFDPPRARVIFAPPLQEYAKKGKPRNLAAFSLIQCLLVSRGSSARWVWGGPGSGSIGRTARGRNGHEARTNETPLYGGGGVDQSSVCGCVCVH